MTIQDGINGFLLLTALAFWLIVVKANKGLFTRFKRQREAKKVAEMIERMKAEAPDMVRNAGREVSELSFRDKDGKLSTVKIVVDASLDNFGIDSEQFQRLMAEGDGGPLEELLHANSDKIETTEEFVFSAKSVRNMRMIGLDPEQIVTKMLKASGRMP